VRLARKDRPPRHARETVALSPRDDAFIAAQIAAGEFNNVSEVVRAGLRLLAREQLKLAPLPQAITAGEADVAAGRVTEYAPGAVAARMKARGRAAAE